MYNTIYNILYIYRYSDIEHVYLKKSPLVMTNSLLLKPWPISFVDLPTKNMAIFHSCLCVYQRVY